MPAHGAFRDRASRSCAKKLFALLVSILFFATTCWSDEKSFGDNINAEFHRIFENCRQAVVRVHSSDEEGARFGSGFFVDAFGTIYTHAGIVSKAGEVDVTYEGRTVPARVIVADTRSGIALLKVEGNTPFIRLGDCSKATVATPVIAVGFPGELEACPSIGIIASHDKHHLGQYFSTTHFRANMAVQQGEGGAPVVNMNGEVIGILVSHLVDASSCHILPIRAAEKVRQDMLRFGELRPGWVGVEVEDIREPVSGSTAQIQALNPQTPAYQAGLRAGDILLSIGGTPINGCEDVLDAAYYLTAGDLADVQVQRGSEKLSISVKPILHPCAAKNNLRAEGPGPKEDSKN